MIYINVQEKTDEVVSAMLSVLNDMGLPCETLALPDGSNLIYRAVATAVPALQQDQPEAITVGPFEEPEAEVVIPLASPLAAFPEDDVGPVRDERIAAAEPFVEPNKMVFIKELSNSFSVPLKCDIGIAHSVLKAHEVSSNPDTVNFTFGGMRFIFPNPKEIQTCVNTNPVFTSTTIRCMVDSGGEPLPTLLSVEECVEGESCVIFGADMQHTFC